MSEWAKAAELQLELQQWLASPNGRVWIHGWVNAVTSDVADGRREMYEMLLNAEASKLATADPIWVSSEMCDIVQMAREGFQPEAIEREDFIVPNGFLYFNEPLYMQDRHHMTVSVGAISWCPVRVASQRELDEDNWGMALTVYSSSRADGDDFAPTHRHFMSEFGGTELVPLHLTVVEFGADFDEGENEDIHGQYTGADEWWKTLQVALRMMQQRISLRVDERVPRPTRRRAQRAKLPMSDDVLVIRLRRPTSKHHDNGDEHTVHWTHQWMVDGHWRWQYYPSVDRHRQIWISPYVKGPEDKELVIKKRYYKWDR